MHNKHIYCYSFCQHCEAEDILPYNNIIMQKTLDYNFHNVTLCKYKQHAINNIV